MQSKQIVMCWCYWLTVSFGAGTAGVFDWPRGAMLRVQLKDSNTHMSAGVRSSYQILLGLYW